jgi:hypothetical protein
MTGTATSSQTEREIIVLSALSDMVSTKISRKSREALKGKTPIKHASGGFLVHTTKGKVDVP